LPPSTPPAAIPRNLAAVDTAGPVLTRSRHYDPSTGRFTRLDPFAGSSQDPVSLHKYAYCSNDPVNRIDPSGDFSFINLGVSMGIGATLMGMVSGGISAATFTRGAIGGAILGGSLYLAFVTGGPVGVGKALAVGTMQGAGGMTSQFFADWSKEPSRPLDRGRLYQAFVDGFVAGVARASIGPFFADRYGWDFADDPGKILALNAAVSGITASVQNLVSGLTRGEPVRKTLGRALLSCTVNAVLSIYADSFAAATASGAENALKEILGEGIGFIVGVPAATLLSQQG